MKKKTLLIRLDSCTMCILCLLTCNCPYLVTTINLIPGISNHHAVIANIGIQFNSTKSCPWRRVFCFEMCDYSSISQEIRNHLTVLGAFARNMMLTNHGFLLRKKKTLQLTDKYIPSTDSEKLNKRRKP